MPFLFANPAGLWALLGIPVILLIHFLQRESKRVEVSTLFLLQHLDRESIQGRRFDRLRNSIPLWLQLLGVLLLAWLLSEPRWASGRSVQRVVLVLDNSASMEAFHEELLEAIRRELPPLTSLVGTTEYTAIESSSIGTTLYRGTSLGDLTAALASWEPAAGSHSPEQALRVGRGLAGSGGILVFVTDHPGEALPFGASRLAVGTALDNVGFAGLRVDTDNDKTVWRATLRNYSDSPQTRSWFLGSQGRRSEARSVVLEPGSTRVLQGEFPEGVDRVSLVLEPDRFTRDDSLHLVKPIPKQLLVSRTGAPSAESLIAGIIGSLENAAQAGTGETPDLWFTTYNPLAPADLPGVSIVLLNQEQVPGRFFSGPLVASNHPLVAELDWQGLIARSTPSIPMAEGDLVLLWQGERPLVFLREGGGKRQLVFNFDVASSNAPRLPAFIVLVHRFAALLRADKIAVEFRNVELRQPLALAYESKEGAPDLEVMTETGRGSVPLARARQLRAPGEPGFFRVGQGGTVLLDAAANFADTREADLSKAGSVSELGALPEAIRERQTEGDPVWFVWVLLLAATMLVTWHLLGRKPQAAVPVAS
jgi:hypothetical protein